MINKKKIMKEIMSWSSAIVITFIITVLLSSKVCAKVQVQQSSMENTLYGNQQLIVEKLSYNFTNVKRGDIVVFLEVDNGKRSIIDDAVIFMKDLKSALESDNNNNNGRLVKRVIGIPGDEVDIKNGCVYINGEKNDEFYVKGETSTRSIKFPIKVGENKLFVLGDNRPVSLDSRDFGTIDYNQIEGKVIFRVYPFDKIGNIK